MPQRTTRRKRKVTRSFFSPECCSCSQRKLREVTLFSLCKEQPQFRKCSPKHMEQCFSNAPLIIGVFRRWQRKHTRQSVAQPITLNLLHQLLQLRSLSLRNLESHITLRMPLAPIPVSLEHQPDQRHPMLKVLRNRLRSLIFPRAQCNRRRTPLVPRLNPQPRRQRRQLFQNSCRQRTQCA